MASAESRLKRLESQFLVDPLDALRNAPDMVLDAFLAALKQGRAEDALKLLGLPPGMPLDCARLEAWLADSENRSAVNP